MDRESLIRRIAKLMRLSESPNPHEAAAAAAKAQDLLIENRLTMTEVERSAQATENPLIEEKFEITSKDGWRHTLAHGVAKAYLCFSVHWRGRSVASHRVALLGRKADIEVAWYMFGAIAAQIDAMAPKCMQAEFDNLVVNDRAREALEIRHHARRWLGDFKVGAAHEVISRLAANKRRYLDPEKSIDLDLTEPNPTAECRALVRASEKEVGEFVKLKYPRLVNGKRARSITSYGAYHAGRAAGKNIDLNVRGLKGGNGNGSLDEPNPQGMADYRKQVVEPRARMLEID